MDNILGRVYDVLCGSKRARSGFQGNKSLLGLLSNNFQKSLQVTSRSIPIVKLQKTITKKLGEPYSG